MLEHPLSPSVASLQQADVRPDLTPNVSSQPAALYIAVDGDAALKMGTCQQCVFEEQGRPARATDADGDQELDFDRDTLFAHLGHLGIVIQERQAYVCP